MFFSAGNKKRMKTERHKAAKLRGASSKILKITADISSKLLLLLFANIKKSYIDNIAS